MIEVKEMSIHSNDAVSLINELNAALTQITGTSGASGFNTEDVKGERTSFVIAYMDGIPYGCAALRKYSDQTAEVKRVYARPNKVGIGSSILQALEKIALRMDYKELILQTREVNSNAVSFYLKNGYNICDNYGIHAENPNAVCFAKQLA